MKRIILISLMSITLIFSISCKKDDKEITTEASFSAKIDGKLWTAEHFLAGHQSIGNTVMISGMSASAADMIDLEFTGSGTGTYKMNDYNMGSVAIGNISCSTFFSDSPIGEIVITKYDVENLKISGTFNFKAEDMSGKDYTISEGKFENIDLVIQ